MKKNLILTLLLFLMIGSTYAQKVKIKGGKVLIDDVAVLDCKSRDFGLETSLYKLNTTDEIVFAKDEKGFNKILFIELDLSVRTNMVFNSIKPFVQWLADNQVIDSKGQINEEKAKLFAKKYHIEK